MKTGFLAYVVYNLDDGGDFTPLGVYGDEDTAIDMLVAELEDNSDAGVIEIAKAYEELFKENVVYTEDYSTKFAYVGIGVTL